MTARAEDVASHRTALEAMIAGRLADEQERVAGLLDKAGNALEIAGALRATADYSRRHPHLLMAATSARSSYDTGRIPYGGSYDAAREVGSLRDLAAEMHALACRIVRAESTYPDGNQHRERAFDHMPVPLEEIQRMMRDLEEPITRPEVEAYMQRIMEEERAPRGEEPRP